MTGLSNDIFDVKHRITSHNHHNKEKDLPVYFLMRTSIEPTSINPRSFELKRFTIMV